jgi:hypothetical protein
MGTAHVSLTPESVGLTLGNMRLEGLFSFLASRSKSSVRTLAPAISEVFKGCAVEVDTILYNIIESRTRIEYQREFEQSFRKYVELSLAMAYIAKAVVPSDSLERLTRESICEIESDFRDKAQVAFGTVVRDQALFTVWTLRKVNEVVTQIVAAKLDPARKREDHEHCAKFTIHALWGQFSLDCLRIALEKEHSIYPEVLEQLIEGMRSMVNAYAHAREGLEVRVPSQEPDVAIPSLDQEDHDLLNVAFAENEHFSLEG